MKKITLLFVLFCAANVFAQPKIIFDTDFGGDSDDLGALAMLHHFVDTGECELLAVVFTEPEIHGVSAIDAVNRFYGHPDIPIGARLGEDYYNDWFYSKAIADRFPHEMSKNDAIEATELYRKILSAADDHSITIVTVGPLVNIRNLLQSPRGKELIEQKVKEFVIMGGQFPEGKWEANFAGFHMPGLTQFVIQNINVPITFLGYEIGVKIKTGKGISNPDTPLYVGYMHFFEHAPWIKKYFKGTMRNNASYDQTAVLYAVRGGIGTWWDRSAPGNCLPDEKGGNRWVDDPVGTHTYLQLTANPAELALLIESIMLQP